MDRKVEAKSLCETNDQFRFAFANASTRADAQLVSATDSRA